MLVCYRYLRACVKPWRKTTENMDAGFLKNYLTSCVMSSVVSVAARFPTLAVTVPIYIKVFKVIYS